MEDDIVVGPLALLVYAVSRVGSEQSDSDLLDVVGGRGNSDFGAVEAWAAARILVERGDLARRSALRLLEETNLGVNLSSSVWTHMRGRSVPWDPELEFSYLFVAYCDTSKLEEELGTRALIVVLDRGRDRAAVALSKLEAIATWRPDLVRATMRCAGEARTHEVRMAALTALREVPWQDVEQLARAALAMANRLSNDGDLEIAASARQLAAKLLTVVR